MSDNEIIKKSLDKTLELDCPNIELTQRGVEKPIKFQGSGTIRQDSEGSVSLKLIHIFTEQQKISESVVRMNYGFSNQGKILPENFYFDLRCEDTYGRTWISKKVYLNNDYYYPSNTVVITSKPINFSRKHKREFENTNYIQFFVPYSIDLPCNKMEEYGNGSSRLSLFEFEFDGIKIRINNSENRLNIYAVLPKEINVDLFGKALLYGLSILAGKQINPTVKLKGIGAEDEIEILSEIKISTKSLPRPINSSIPYPHQPTVEFLSGFIKSYLINNVNIREAVGYWHKVFISYGASIEVFALTLTTSIEGVFKNSYSPFLFQEASYVSKLENSIRELNKTKIDSEIKSKILSSIGGYKKKSIKSAMLKYVSETSGYSDYPNTWSELRNQSSHADSMDQSKEKIQCYFDKAFICLSLFYLFILDAASYKGDRIGYGQQGWPDVDKNGIKV